MRHVTQRRLQQRGFALLAVAACGLVLFGMAGLAIDLGRMYITKNEAQTFADSASLYAAMQLDGASSGLTAADSAVTNNSNKWNFGTTSFSGTITEYSTDQTNWYTSSNVPMTSIPNIRYV